MAAGLSAPGRRRHQSRCLGPKGIVLAGGEKTGTLGLPQQSQDGPEGAARNARDEEGRIEVDGHGRVGEHGLEGTLARSALGDDDGTEPPPRRRRRRRPASGGRGRRCHAPVRVGVGVGVGVGVARLWDGMGWDGMLHGMGRDGMGMGMEVERHQSGRSEKVGGRRRPQQRPSFDPKRISFHRCYAYERTVCIRSTTLLEYMRIISFAQNLSKAN